MKGYALLIGVNEVCSEHYEDRLLLKCAKQDVIEMEKLFKKIPSYKKIFTLTDSHATFDNVTDRLNKIYELAANEETAYLTIFYSGHGTAIPESLHEQPDQGEIGFFCFHDKMISENQIRSSLSKIDSKFTVFVISDSCNSGEIQERAFEMRMEEIKKLGESQDEFSRKHEIPVGYKSPPYSYIKEVFKKRKETYLKDLRSFPKTVFEPQAETAIMTACRRDQLTEANYYNGMPSAFTKTILAAWSHRKPIGYTLFQKNIARIRPKEHQPQIGFYGSAPSDFFNNTRPFAMNFNTNEIEDLDENNFTEIDGDIVSLKNLPSESSGFKYKDSNSYHITDPSNNVPTIVADLKKMGCNLTDVRVLAVVHVSIQGGEDFPHEIEKFKSDFGNNGVGGFVVVLNKSANNAILHKGRTKGKVSNSLG